MRRVSMILAALAVVVGGIIASAYFGVIPWRQCDVAGSTCCGPDSEVKTQHCHQGLGCNVTTGVCATCGAPGQPCCDGDFTGFSMKGYTGILLDPKERIDSCNAGATCDARLAPDGKSWTGTRICQACGTKEDAACCAPDVRYAIGRCFADAATGTRLICHDAWAGAQSTCVPCGRVAGEQACLTGHPCNDWMVERNGLCATCGDPGTPTCDRGEPCRGQAAPNKRDTMCIPAGGPGQPCLSNGKCNYGRMFCNPAKLCEPCGNGGQPCCPPSEGVPCEVGQCVDGRCFACGYVNMPVCAGNNPCPHNGEPLNGFCRPCGKENQRCCYEASIRCEAGMTCPDGTCKRTGGGSSGGGNNEQWKTCSGQPWTWSTKSELVWVEDVNGCIASVSYHASTPEEALLCARGQYGERAIGPTVQSFAFAVSCPNTGCNQVTYYGRDHDSAENCVETTWIGCGVDDGACP